MSTEYEYNRIKSNIKSFFERNDKINPLNQLTNLCADSDINLFLAYRAYDELYGLTIEMKENLIKLKEFYK